MRKGKGNKGEGRKKGKSGEGKVSEEKRRGWRREEIEGKGREERV